MPSFSRLRAYIALVIPLILIIGAYGLYQRDKAIRTEQMTAQYNLGYRTAENDLMKAAMAEGRRATLSRDRIEHDTRRLTDNALLRDMSANGWLRD